MTIRLGRERQKGREGGNERRDEKQNANISTMRMRNSDMWSASANCWSDCHASRAWFYLPVLIGYPIKAKHDGLD